MLNDLNYGIKGLILPNGESVRDQRYADDMNLYIGGSPENLQRVYNVLEAFSFASGSKINWNKSFALAIDESTRTNKWGEDKGLRWLEPGTPARYLGFQFGININREDRDAAILHHVRSKLTLWSSRKLFALARVLVTNQVVLANIWFLASCSDVSDSSLLKSRALVRNFIWGGLSDKQAQAKVKWSTAVIPTVKGGIKVFDPMAEAKALLAKLIPRAMVPGKEPWKSMVRHRLNRVCNFVKTVIGGLQGRGSRRLQKSNRMA